MTNAPKEVEVAIPGSDDIIIALPYTLSFEGNSSFNILVNKEDGDDISTGIAKQAYDFPLSFYLFSKLAGTKRNILDLGAHIGTFSLLAAKFGHNVVAVEASPRNAALVQGSAQLNSFDNLKVISAAISDHAETIEFIQAGPYGLVAIPQLQNPTISVQAENVDAILERIGWDKVDIIKMDIEGSEVKGVAGMAKLLSRDDAPVILYESNGHTLSYFNETPNNLMAALEKFGYSCFLIEPGQLIPVRSTELQFSCTVDYIASKSPLESLPGWSVTAPLSREQQIAQLIEMASHAHPHVRAYIARTLRDADMAILSDSRVIGILKRLQADSDPDVQRDISWLSQEKMQEILLENQNRETSQQGPLTKLLKGIQSLWQ